jgi:hypothetical protein
MKRRRLWLAGLMSASLFAVVAACTAFDDVPLPGAKPPDASPAVEASVEDASTTTGILSLAEAAKVCSLVARCVGLGESLAASLRVSVVEPSYSLCLTELATDIEPGRQNKSTTAKALRDVAAADTCAAAGGAVFIDVFRGGDPRCAYDAAPGTPLDTCLDPSTSLHCFGPGKNGFSHHCNRPHRTGLETCVAFDGGADCVLGASCPGTTCSGAVLEECRPAQALPLYYSRTDCAALGMQCAVANQRIGCSTDGKDIRLTGMKFLGAHCEGDLRHTQSEVYFGLTDCKALGGKCVGSGQGAICALPSDECSPFNTVDTCAGTTWNGCVGGKKKSFDCASIGKACAIDASPGAVAAACY